MYGVYDDIRFLAGSPLRVRILDLLDSGSRSARDMGEDLGVARTTLKGNLEKLHERGWVETSEDGYRISFRGRVVVREFLRFQNGLKDAMDAVEEAEPLLRWITMVDIVVLRGGVVTTPEAGDPHVPLQRFVEIVENARVVRGFSSVVLPVYVETFHRCVRENDLHAELVVESGAKHVIESKYQGEWREAVESGECETYVYDGRLPFGLAIVDDRAVVVGYDDEGFPRAILENENTGAVEWAEETYNKYRKKSQRLTPPDTA